VPEAHARQDPASVPDVLLAWIQALSGLDQAQRIQQAVLHLLNSRPGYTQAKPAQVPALASLPHLNKCQGSSSEYLPDSSGASRKLHERQCLGVSAFCMMSTVACSLRGCCNSVQLGINSSCSCVAPTWLALLMSLFHVTIALLLPVTSISDRTNCHHCTHQ